MNIVKYNVDAGKVEMRELRGTIVACRNYKYSDTFDRLEDALVAYNLALGYAFCELVMTVEIQGNRYDIVLDPEQTLIKDTNEGKIK